MFVLKPCPIQEIQRLIGSRSRVVRQVVYRNYVRSDTFKSLSSGYRKILHSHADNIMATGGNVPISQIGTKHNRKDRAE